MRLRGCADMCRLHLRLVWARQIELIDDCVPPRPLTAGGRLTLNRLTRGAERRQSPEGDRYIAVTPVSPL